jgi:hypothetical protein
MPSRNWAALEVEAPFLKSAEPPARLAQAMMSEFPLFCRTQPKGRRQTPGLSLWDYLA